MSGGGLLGLWTGKDKNTDDQVDKTTDAYWRSHHAHQTGDYPYGDGSSARTVTGVPTDGHGNYFPMGLPWGNRDVIAYKMNQDKIGMYDQLRDAQDDYLNNGRDLSGFSSGMRTAANRNIQQIQNQTGMTSRNPALLIAAQRANEQADTAIAKQIQDQKLEHLNALRQFFGEMMAYSAKDATL